MSRFVREGGLWLPAPQPATEAAAPKPWGWDQIVAALNRLEEERQAAKRTVLCEPHREHQIRAAVDQLDAADIFTVKASPACPEGKLLIIDERALDAL